MTWLKHLGGKISALENRHHKLILTLSLILSLAVFAAICALNIGRWSVWFDESFGRFMMQFNFGGITHYAAHDVHPPLYYWLLKIWTSGFGLSDISLRFPSLLFGLATIVMGFLLVRRAAGKAAGYAALLLLPITPLLLRYGVEARMYTMLAFFGLSSTYCLLRATGSDKRRWKLLYVITTAAGMWTQYLMILVIAAQWLWRGVVKFQAGARGKKFVREFFGQSFGWASLTVLLIFAPWLPIALHQFTSVEGGFWIPAISTATPADYLSHSWLYLHTEKATGWNAALIIAVVILLIICLVKMLKKLSGRRRQTVGLILSVAIVPVALLILISLPPLKSGFVDRYLLPSVAALTLVIAIAATAKIKSKWPGRILLILTVATFALGAVNLVRIGNDEGSYRDYKSLLKQVDAATVGTEPLISNDSTTVYVLAAYETPSTPAKVLRERLADWGSTLMLRDQPSRIVGQNSLKPGSRVWYIDTNPNAAPPRPGWRKGRQIKLAGFDLVATEYIIAE
jgi:4-amino-4-deoxy-L-arabinose transferase-like glycosyltransferase